MYLWARENGANVKTRNVIDHPQSSAQARARHHGRQERRAVSPKLGVLVVLVVRSDPAQGLPKARIGRMMQVEDDLMTVTDILKGTRFVVDQDGKPMALNSISRRGSLSVAARRDRRCGSSARAAGQLAE